MKSCSLSPGADCILDDRRVEGTMDMADEGYPADLRYHSEHDWTRIDGDIATFGITWFAQDNLQEIVFFEAPAVGDKVTKDRPTPKSNPSSRSPTCMPRCQARSSRSMAR